MNFKTLLLTMVFASSVVAVNAMDTTTTTTSSSDDSSSSSSSSSSSDDWGSGNTGFAGFRNPFRNH